MTNPCPEPARADVAPTAGARPAAYDAQWRIALALFFGSGMAGISYEVIWFKQFSHVWGSSTLAMASVIGSFLLGLGLGAAWWGRRSEHLERPILWYGLIEIAVGLFALLVPFATEALWRFSVAYYAPLREHPMSFAVARSALTFVAICLPCGLLGGTLPLLVRQFARCADAGVATSWLYGANTLGAAFGCYLVGFHLLPAWGLATTNLVA